MDMKKIYKIKNNTVFKNIFYKEENKELLVRLIKKVIRKDITVISLNVPQPSLICVWKNY